MRITPVATILVVGLLVLSGGSACTGGEPPDEPPASDAEAGPAGDPSGVAPADLAEDGLAGSFDCGGQTISVGGSGVDVELTGTCLTVSVNGDDGTVAIETATTVVVNGRGNRVTVGEADTITVNGDDSHVTYSGDPVVTVNGTDATAEEG
jgi:hypothetical protein